MTLSLDKELGIWRCDQCGLPVFVLNGNHKCAATAGEPAEPERAT